MFRWYLKSSLKFINSTHSLKHTTGGYGKIDKETNEILSIFERFKYVLNILYFQKFLFDNLK